MYRIPNGVLFRTCQAILLSIVAEQLNVQEHVHLVVRHDSSTWLVQHFQQPLANVQGRSRYLRSFDHDI